MWAFVPVDPGGLGCREEQPAKHRTLLVPTAFPSAQHSATLPLTLKLVPAVWHQPCPSHAHLATPTHPQPPGCLLQEGFLPPVVRCCRAPELGVFSLPVVHTRLGGALSQQPRAQTWVGAGG